MSSDDHRDELNSELNEALAAGVRPSIARFALACLGGIPALGGIFGAGAGAWSDAEQARFKSLLAGWLRLQEDEIREIGKTLFEVMTRLDSTDAKVRERVESPEYLSLVKKCFRDWSAAESEDKRKLIRNLLTNAAGATKLCGDDVIRMFIDWIERYSEKHFAIIKAVLHRPGTSRLEMWEDIYGQDSARGFGRG